ncbi:MAG: YceI family protein [Chloroflexi bacterium]|nr:YceI family protein [Chloroflexota bacterium]
MKILAASLLVLPLVAACAGPPSDALQAAPTVAPATASTAASPKPAVASIKPSASALASVSPSAKPAASTAPASAAASTAPASAAAGAPASASAGGVTIALNSNASKLDIKMREVLAANKITTDAVESTQAVSGTIKLDAAGNLAPGSKLSIDLRALQSDRGARDNFIKGRFVLDTGTFPTADFVPTQVDGLGGPPPASGSKTFKLIGNSTVKGVTKPMTWDVTASFDGQGCSGQATTAFKLSDYGLKIPQLPSVVSVEDQGSLALSFQASKTVAP